jgi:hypothetical protein
MGQLKLNLTSLQLFCGTNWSWIESPLSYPAPDYSLQLILKLGSSPAIVINGVAEDTSFRFIRTASENAALIQGSYSYQFIASSGDDRYLVESGTVRILPLLSTSGDTRSYWERVRDNAKEAYEKLTSREIQSITTDGGDTVTYEDRAKLIRTIRHAENEIARENGTAAPKIFKSRFV